MAFIVRWLRGERPKGATLWPSRSIVREEPFDALFDRIVAAVDRILGGVVREADRASGRIEATFGLMFSERLTCRLERVDASHTRVHIETRQGVRAEAIERSIYVDRLAKFVETGE